MGFGSLEAANYHCRCSATDCISWWTWTGAGAAGIINGGLSGAALQNTKQSGRNVSRGVLTAMSVKIL
jgi:hypothetical protein